MSDTIFALATASGRAGVAVVRVSGPRSNLALTALTGRDPGPARRLEVAEIRVSGGSELLDRGMVVWFGKPQSYTGEDMVEFHLHGGPAVVVGVLEALARLPGCRAAQPGEFTRRAFESGKLDLTEVEGIADLIAAETSAQRRQAVRQMSGALGQIYENWHRGLMRLLAHAEADIDFADEELPTGLAERVNQDIRVMAAEMAAYLADQRRGERLRDGYRVGILGAPNVGKSTLLNALAQRDAAIVSARAGTTRDVIEIHLDLNGYPVVLADTAGFRTSPDDIEIEGMRRALAWAEGADLNLILVDPTTEQDMMPELQALVGERSLVVLTKADAAAVLRSPTSPMGIEPNLKISAKTGLGMDALIGLLANRV
ncbi:MAG: tRNA uridine-5-carboxymethylaminomethyl(34) synthesis GTPase MnmE, partial [Alphaproteobacteria bacterium]|nr:tRNA uridine-5-carboxymethylaminomethyl(34) synthesis GTPase MnmE [Alphaproteobacteria bacterium]